MKNIKTIFLIFLFFITSVSFAFAEINITILNPINNSEFNSPSVLLNWTYNKSISGSWYSLDGGSNISLGISQIHLISPSDVSCSGGVSDCALSVDNDLATGLTNSIDGGAYRNISINFSYPYTEVIDLSYTNFSRLDIKISTNSGARVPIYCFNSTNPNRFNTLSQNDFYLITNDYEPFSTNTGVVHTNHTIPSECFVNGEIGIYFVGYVGGTSAGDFYIYEVSLWLNPLNSTNLTSLSEGTHNLIIYANDSNGNIEQSSYVYFTINNQTPQWSDNQTNITANTILNDVGQFNVTLTDNIDLNSYTSSWNISGFWENFTTIFIDGTNTTIIINKTINQSTGKHKAWTVYFNDSIGNTNQTDIFTFNIKNQLPSVASATINNTSPLPTDDLQCDNGSLSDPDSDTISLFYNWTKGGTDQAISTKTLDNSLTTAGDNWVCKITPFDGFENGTTVTSSTVSIGTGFVAPFINFTNSTPLTAELLKGEWINLSVNFTDTSEGGIDNHTAYFCKTDSATTDGCSQTWCVSPINITGNYTSCRLDITDSSDFYLQEYTFYTFVVDNTSLISASKSNTFTIQDITPPTFPYYSLQYTNLNDASGNTIEFNVSMSDNVSNVNSISFLINGTLNISRSFTFTSNLTVNTSYKIFETNEVLAQGLYNITRVTVTDNSSNSKDYNFTNITFTVSSAPSAPPSGGGGGVVIIIEENITVITEICNFNNICEPPEDFLNCPSDCEFTIAQINPLCIFRPVPGVPCIYTTGIFIKLTVLLAIISILILVSGTETGLKGRKWIKEKTKFDFKF